MSNECKHQSKVLKLSDYKLHENPYPTIAARNVEYMRRCLDCGKHYRVSFAEAGDKITVYFFDRDQLLKNNRCILVNERTGEVAQTQIEYLHNCYDGFEAVGLEQLEEQLCESTNCTTPIGSEVEPDGVDEHGCPSWLLVLGLI